MEERVSGFRGRGSWADVVDHGDRITRALRAAGVDETALTAWEGWRPKAEDRLEAEVSERTVEEATLEDVEAILTEAGVTNSATIDAVKHCVAVHDDFDYRGDPRSPDTVEAAVLQDADNLDALGAVGVGRCFAFGGDRGLPLWRPGGGDDPCVLGHFDEKLFKLQDECNTETARAMAADRIAFLEEFAERFRREWRGEL